MAYQGAIPKSPRSERRKLSVHKDDNVNRYYGDRNEKYKRHGKGVYYFVSGDYYIGNWRKGRMEGQGKYVHAGGETYPGWFYKNEYVGRQPNDKLKWKVARNLIPAYSPNEEVDYDDERYVGAYKKGRHHGEGAYYFPDGSFYMGNWRKGRMEGRGIFVDEYGTELIGWFYKSKFVGDHPNEKLRTKIRRGMIPDPNATSTVRSAESIDSDSEAEGILAGAVGFERQCRKLAGKNAKKYQ